MCRNSRLGQPQPSRAVACPPSDLCTRPSSASEASRAASRRHLCSRPCCCRCSKAVVRRSGHSISHSGLSGQRAQRPEPLSSPPASPSARPHLLVPEQPGGCHVLVVHKCGPHGPPGVTVGHSGWAGPKDPAHRQVSAPPAPRGNPREQPGEPPGPGRDLRKPRRGGPRPSWRHSQAGVARVAPEPWLPSRPTRGCPASTSGCPSPRPDAAEQAQA